MASIIDIAKMANVSKTTVSRVLNNNGYVAKDTREKIERIMKEMNYFPSSFAQNIRTRKSRTIAMMVPDSSNTFYMEMFKAVEEITLKENYMVILCDTRRNIKNEMNYAEKLLQRSIDGLLYFTQQRVKENEEFFVDFSKKVPTIFMDYAFAEIENIHCVAVEGRNCSRQAVEYLYRLGKRKIGYINLPKTNSVSFLRYEGYRQGIEKLGLSDDPALMVLAKQERGRTLVDLGYAATHKLLKENPDVDAIMAASDHLAVGAIKYMRNHKIRVPEKVSVIGFDDTDLCEIISPTLTTIRQPIKAIGHDAASLLLELINDRPRPANKIIYEGELVKRSSTPAE